MSKSGIIVLHEWGHPCAALGPGKVVEANPHSVTLKPRDPQGEYVSVPVDWAPLDASSRLIVERLGPAEATLLVCFAERLTDAYATVAALAAARGLRIATDERKLRRVAADVLPDVRLVGALQLVRATAERMAWPATEVRDILTRLRERACILPPRGDDEAGWAERILRASS